MKRLPIGISDFKDLIEKNYYYIDKTLLIKELLDRGSAVTLLPRPRRFGKTINLSMLYYFFSNTEHTQHLFVDTAIAQHPDIMTHQGKYPVIFITFKDVKISNWHDACTMITNILSQEFKRHKNNLFEQLDQEQKNYYSAVLDKKLGMIELSFSIKFLADILSKYCQKKVIILLDEYDAPIHAAYIHGYYKEMVEFIRNLFSAALKDNSSLEFGVMTGILRTAKEGIFSGLNNLDVYTLLNKEFSDKFGFTRQEVEVLLADYALQQESETIKQWYDGYKFAGTTIYNPWSLLNCVNKSGNLALYWSNTSDNALVKRLLTHASTELLQQLESILQGSTVRQRIEEAFIFPNMESNELIVWSLLVFSGYLTPQQQELVMGRFMCDLAIPNQEIHIIYEDLLTEILNQPLRIHSIRMLLSAIQQGDGMVFEKIIQEYVLNSMSMFDLPNDEPEKSYHLFVLGLLVVLSDTYEVRSNRESGYGRYDITLIPKNTKERGIIIEFKKAGTRESLEDATQQAMAQIHSRQYAAELRDQGVSNITAFGIAFKGKEVLLAQEVL